jgi:UDP-3-O-[3-hydroxymyristoyl] N-acetylglucosamine deacetylase
VSARAFGYAADRERLMERGLARGAALTNTVVIHHGSVVNAEGLRFADEFVRHKLLDVVGDLALAGAPILGEYVAHLPGHALTAALLRKLFRTDTAWRLRTMTGAAAEVVGRHTPRRMLEDWMRGNRRSAVSRVTA